MLSSISPLGERARATRWGTTVSAYLLGSTLGGLALGFVAALVGSLVPQSARSSMAVTLVVGAALLLLAGLDLLASAAEGRAPRLRLPSWQRQVDEQWLGRYRGWVYGLGFGVQLGFGVLTIITSATVDGSNVFRFNAPVRLFDISSYGRSPQAPSYDVAADGRFLMVKPDLASAPRIVVVVNWASRLRRSASH